MLKKRERKEEKRIKRNVRFGGYYRAASNFEHRLYRLCKCYLKIIFPTAVKSYYNVGFFVIGKRSSMDLHHPPIGQPFTPFPQTQVIRPYERARRELKNGHRRKSTDLSRGGSHWSPSSAQQLFRSSAFYLRPSRCGFSCQRTAISEVAS